MFSYRHSFHAGNHADVLKHVCQIALLNALTRKAKPAIYIDTHSGAGSYQLDAQDALKTREFETGITKLTHIDGQHEALQTYQALIRQYQQSQQYPGSPLIAGHLLRSQDRIALMEFHNSEIDNLRHNLRQVRLEPKVSIHHRDGFEGLLALLPPQPARGLVLIDPPYEQAQEYQQVLAAMQKAMTKWPTGIYAIWYPLLSARAQQKSGMSEKLRDQLAQLNAKSVLNVELQISANTPDAGMYGSGLVILNPPWQLDVALQELIDELLPLLADPQQGSGQVRWLKREA